MPKTVDKVLGSISPLYGAVSGRGLFGTGLAALGDAIGPAVGVLPVVASEQRRKRKAGDAPTQNENAPAMRKGGKVSSIKAAIHKHERNMHKGKPLTKMAKGGAARRADGIAKKGHTRGKMC
jgi:hypothetical protein